MNAEEKELQRYISANATLGFGKRNVGVHQKQR